MTKDEAQAKLQTVIDELLAEGWEVWGWDDGTICSWKRGKRVGIDGDDTGFEIESTVGKARNET